MELIFEKKQFPKSPGGHGYVWKEVAINFNVQLDGKYILAVTASASNAKSKNSSDDDDLRLALDGYEFGKYEKHDEKASWKGFGTASSWDGTTLRGGNQTIYFFADLQKGRHSIENDSDLAKKIKNDKSYAKILGLIKQQVQNGILIGEIYLGGDMEVNFKKTDLQLSLHGLKKIEYNAIPQKGNAYQVQIHLFDIYDFDPRKYSLNPTWIPVHMADVLEAKLILKNFEIEIYISDILYV